MEWIYNWYNGGAANPVSRSSDDSTAEGYVEPIDSEATCSAYPPTVWVIDKNKGSIGTVFV